MLEILSHKYLKNFLKFKNIDWDHIYSFGRLISKCIQTNQNYLINSEIFLTDKWHSALLISLFLNEEDSYFVLSKQEIEELKNKHLVQLKKFGFKFEIINNQLIFAKHKILLISLQDFLRRYKKYNFTNQRIVLKDVQNLKQDLKNNLKISLDKKDWFRFKVNNNFQDKEIEQKYNLFKKIFFARSIPNQEKVHLYKNELILLREFFLKNEYFSKEFSRVKYALFSSWACWVTLNYENFEWKLILEPIDEILEIRELLRKNNFIFLSAFRKDNFFQKYLKNHNLNIDLVLNFKSDFDEKKIPIYIPPRQLLPNNPLFIESIFNQCMKLFLLKKEFTLILCNSNDLKINLATQLASKYGHFILLETPPINSNSILLASYDWWITNQIFCQSPDQIIIPLLPIPDITDPFNEQTIFYHLNNSSDWFRDFLLPEAINKLDKAVLPLRKNAGSLVILDGRARNREWGREFINMIQPSKIFNHLFPFE